MSGITSKYRCLVVDKLTQLVTLAVQQGHKNELELVEWGTLQENPQMKSSVKGIILFGRIPNHWKLQELPKLKVISNHGVGVDHLDIPEIKERNIKICNTPGVVGPSTAEIAFGLMIATARRFKEASSRLHIQHGGNDTINGFQVTGSTLGIVGLGSIGGEVAKRATAFDMPVYYHQRSRNTQKEVLYGATYCPTLDDLLPRCDFIVLCCPYSAQTHHLISKAQLQRMKTGSFIINVGRGALINTEDLVGALKSGHLRGAGLDVTDPEPLPQDHPLMSLPNVFLTPHLGTNTEQTRSVMAKMTVTNLLSALNETK